MINQPLITVILNSYNHEKFLHHAIDSVLNQTYQHFELIIWDDCSTDSSWDIIKSYDDSRIKVFKNDENQRGIYGINNAIFRESKGQYIAIHHSDDTWAHDKLEKQVKFLNDHPMTGAVFTHVNVIDEDGKDFVDEDSVFSTIFKQPNREQAEWISYFLKNGNCLCHPSVLVRRSVYEEVGPYRYGLAQLGDFDMWTRICSRYDIHIIQEPLTNFRVLDSEKNTSAPTIGNNIALYNEYLMVAENLFNSNVAQVMGIEQSASTSVEKWLELIDTTHLLPLKIYGLKYVLTLINQSDGLANTPRNRSLYIHSNRLVDTFGLQKDGLILKEKKRCEGFELEKANLERQILQQEIAISELQDAIIRIKNSTSWKVTAPLRALTYLSRGETTHFKLALAHRMPLVHKVFGSSHGGVKRKLQRAYQVLRNEGMSAAFHKISTYLTTSQGHSGGPIIGEEEYREWITSKRDVDKQEAEQIIHALESQPGPLISIIVPTYNTDELFLKQCIDSVLNQSYPNWELCLADDASTNENIRDVITDYCQRDGRIKTVLREENGHISAASNSAISIAEGEWMALLDHDDELHEHALSYVAHTILTNPQVEFVYTDEDKINECGERFDPHFKPDWNPDLLYSQNYISHLGVYKSSIVKKIGGFRIGFEGSQDYDLLLRYSREIDDANIVHIPRVLYHWRAIEGSTALEAGQKDYTTQKGIDALQEYFDQQQTDAQVVKGKNANTYRVKWSSAGNPLVSLIIPTYNGIDITKQAIDSILNKTSYKNYEIILVDNNSDDDAALEYFSQLEKDDKVTVLRYPYPFNYSAINNFAVRHANGDIVGLVNNDVEVINSDWLTEMVSHAIRPEVGCVGAKLYYSNDTIQHAGIILGIGGVAGHSHKHFPRDSHGYFGRLNLVQNLSSVTAACLLIRKEVFDQVGGLNETDLTVAFNDVDFCLRVRELGYRNLWTPYAELYHHESISRGHEDNPEKVARFNKEVNYMNTTWGNLLISDPSYNVNLTLSHENFSISKE